MSTEAILKPINYESTDPIFLITDASVKGIGAWIGQGPSTQDIQPAAFYSRTFKPAELNYSVTEEETLAIMDGLRHFQPHLNGSKFMILTDHAACLAFPKTPEVTDRNERWLKFLSGFDYTIQYLEGKKNILADTLSRYFKNPARPSLIIRKPDPNKQQQQQQETTTSKHPTTTSLPTNLYVFTISQCLLMHRSLLLKSASSATQRKNRPHLFFPPSRSPLVPHHGLRQRRKIIKMNGTTLPSSQRLT